MEESNSTNIIESTDENPNLALYLQADAIKDDFKQAWRPKTSISKEEAKQYELEGQEGADIDPTREIFFTSEIKIQISGEDKYINEFKVLGTIGQGSYSKVKHVIRQFKEDDKICEDDYAMKMMHRPTLRRERCAIYSNNGKFEISNALEKVYCEIEVWSQVHHENIVKLFELIESEGHDYIYLIIEYWDLGQLSTWDYKQEIYWRNNAIIDYFLNNQLKGIEFKSDDEMIEAVAKIIFKDVISGVECLHSKNFAHRDIKPDNVLVNSKDGKAKISDFSVSVQLNSPEDRLYSWDGTIAYAAPESHVPDENGFLVLPTDIWSVGVCMFTYITQRVPFFAESELEMQLNAQKNDVPKIENVSDNWNDIIQKMTSKDPLKRPTASQLLEHPWFNS